MNYGPYLSETILRYKILKDKNKGSLQQTIHCFHSDKACQHH